MKVFDDPVNNSVWSFDEESQSYIQSDIGSGRQISKITGRNLPDAQKLWENRSKINGVLTSLNNSVKPQAFLFELNKHWSSYNANNNN
jgi:hypothetical protein